MLRVLFASGAENKTGGFRQKPRSTTNWPVLACSFSTSAADIFGSAIVWPLKACAMFSIAVRFQPLIMVGWMPDFLTSSADVSSSRMASRAAFALNSAE